MELVRKAARQTAALRLVALAVVVALLAGTIPWPPLIAGGLIAAVASLALLRAANEPPLYDAWGEVLGSVVRGVDIAAISLAIVASHDGHAGFHLLYIIDIVAAGYVVGRPRTIALTVASCAAGYVGAAVLAHPQATLGNILLGALGPLAVLVCAGIGAGSLRIYKQRDDALQRRDRKLSTLLEFGTRFASGEDAARVMEQTLRAAIRDTDASAGYIMLAAPGAEELFTEVAVSFSDDRAFPVSARFGEGIDGYVAQTGKHLVLSREQERREIGGPKSEVRSPGSGPTANSHHPAPGDLQYDGEAVLCIPMVEGGAGVVGVFTLISYRSGSRFVDEDVDLARTLAGLATMAVVNSRLYEDLRGSFVRSLQSLAKTLEAKDPYTQGHSYRVSELCVMIGRKLRVANEILEDLRNGALLHDVGKIGVPDAILTKPARLTDEEFEIMKQHTIIGYEICKQLGLGDAILMLIRNHHEKLDGSGYPDGLKLGELPLPLRIICVADAFDAMSSSRPYRKLMDAETRNQQLNRFAGTQFDPVVVETLKALLNAGELDELYKDQWVHQAALPSEPPAMLRAA